ncbi:hypothetical protein [Polynucleobacter sp. MG-27-Goln-C1]|uniref:hypothetical protein n=1 Tax=Polynucleobacter sp. MG-27-Goln-C1 TaxID=1819726 RepID=UPI001C0E67BD|nr:hypothetical protein [Polynucleobacter sp. MG-27-Goln-C1]MBU3612166.1 hypothetical protein [Polynucleobacter sp. MG-27-Goln-C1]
MKATPLFEVYVKFSLCFIIFPLILLGGCANSVLLNATHSYTGDSPMMNLTIRVHQQDLLISQENQLSSMTLSLSPDVQNGLAELTQRGFSQDKFSSTIKEKLVQLGLLNESSGSGLKLELTVVDANLVDTVGSIILANASDGVADFAKVNYSKIAAIIRDSSGKVVDDYLYWRVSDCDYCDKQHRAQVMYDITASITARAISVKGH